VGGVDISCDCVYGLHLMIHCGRTSFTFIFVPCSCFTVENNLAILNPPFLLHLQQLLRQPSKAGGFVCSQDTRQAERNGPARRHTYRQHGRSRGSGPVARVRRDGREDESAWCLKGHGFECQKEGKDIRESAADAPRIIIGSLNKYKTFSISSTTTTSTKQAQRSYTEKL